MNSDKDLIYRLLRLMPVSELKQLVADSKGKNQVELISEVQNSQTLEDVKKEIVKQYGHLKQHVYIYTLRRTSKGTHVKSLLKDHFMEVGMKHYFFQKCTFTVKGIYEGTSGGNLSNRLEPIHVEFLQPCMLKIENNRLVVCFTILEKSISSYLPDYKIYETTVDLKEENSLCEIEAQLKGSIVIEDLNKGIKYLWEKDIIDSKYVTFKKTASLSREIMDEELTYKETYPDDYKNVLNAPLQKTTFRITNSQFDMCDFLTVPSDGMISFNKFPENKNQIENVITQIIKNN